MAMDGEKALIKAALEQLVIKANQALENWENSRKKDISSEMEELLIDCTKGSLFDLSLKASNLKVQIESMECPDKMEPDDDA